MTAPMRVDGVDISHHQNGKLDLARAKKAGVKFLYHKATEGETYKDPNYDKRRAEAKAAGIPFGGYHFARPGTTDAVKRK
jgi:lysozyme